jgi:hypothetical protein
MNWRLKLTVWRLNYGPSALIALALKRLPVPTKPSLIALTVCLGILVLSGCAAAPPCPAPRNPPKELMEPPPPPGDAQKRLEKILEKGRTSAPT